MQQKWYIIDSETKGGYSHHDPIKFLTKSIKSSLCDYSDDCVLVTRDIGVTRTIAASAKGNDPQRKQALTAATQVVFKNCAPFKKCITKINGTFFDGANFINIAMSM